MASSSKQQNTIEDFFAFISAGVTPFHATETARGVLLGNGFSELSPADRWSVEAGGKYVIRLGDGGLIAVRPGARPLAENGAAVLVAHTDSPALRVKERAVSWRKGYLSLPTELYGGPIVSTWLDRELGIAGRAVTPGGDSLLVDLPLRAVVPNLAIHLNRKVNEGYKYNQQDHLMALAGVSNPDGESSGGELAAIVAKSIGRPVEEVWEYELYLYDPQPGSLVGINRDLLTAPRIDNLSGCFCCLNAFLDAETDRTLVLALYNHEEIGSVSGEGAQSAALSRTLDRLVHAQGGDTEDSAMAAARSILVSNDVAHALHPSFAEKYDPDYAPLLNGGPVLKLSAAVKYATNPATGALFRNACERAGVPMQRLVNRSDVPSGSTVGPASWARTGIPTVDMGIGILAMHSIRETAGVRDLEMTTRVLREIAEE